MTMTPLAPAAAARITLRRGRTRLGRSGGRSPQGVAGALAPVGIVTLVCLALPLLAPHGPLDITKTGALHGLSGSAWLGTDDIGRDIFSRVLFGIRTSWLSALAVIVVGAAIGSLVGALAGSFGGWIDTVLMRLTDLFLSLPAPVLAIAVIAAMGPSLFHTLLALSIVWWPWYARIVRGEVRALATVTDRVPPGTVWMRDGWAGLNTLTSGAAVLPDAAVDLFDRFSGGQAEFESRVDVAPDCG